MERPRAGDLHAWGWPCRHRCSGFVCAQRPSAPFPELCCVVCLLDGPCNLRQAERRSKCVPCPPTGRLPPGGGVYPGWLDGLVLAPIQRLPAGDRVCARRLAGL